MVSPDKCVYMPLILVLLLLTVSDMFRNINANLVLLKNLVTSQIREVKSLRADLSSLNDSVSNLSMCLQEHKQQTAAELAQLQTSLQSSLTTHTQQVNAKLNNHTRQLEDMQRDVTNILGPHTCGGTGGWRRVVYLDMTDPSTTCPSGWQLTGYSKRTCGRASDGSNTCDSVTFPVSGGEYSRVCGRIKAYQLATTDAFQRYHHEAVNNIDGAYVDGISLTHSSPRQHIWTFAAGLSEGNPTWYNVCPCDASHTIRVPPFVGNDYFCESGVNEPWGGHRHWTLHPNDTLWDGENCLSSSTCCSLHNPPYFVKQLSTPTTDDIEARICLDEPSSVENIAVELVELYVQ